MFTIVYLSSGDLEFGTKRYAGLYARECKDGTATITHLCKRSNEYLSTSQQSKLTKRPSKDKMKVLSYSFH